MAGPYTDIIVAQSGAGVSRSQFGVPVQAAINDLHSRVTATEAEAKRSWSKTTSSNGTATTSGSATKVRDAVMGNLSITGMLTSRLYKCSFIGEFSLSASTASLIRAHIFRVSGTGTPLDSDTQILNVSGRRDTTGANGQEELGGWRTFTVPSSGTYTFAMFTENATATAITLTPVNYREILIEDLGPV